MIKFSLFIDMALDVVIDDYRPGRAAPICSNPSHPDFSDPGDEPEWNKIFFYYTDDYGNKHRIQDEFLCQYLEDVYIEQIILEADECIG